MARFLNRANIVPYWIRTIGTNIEWKKHKINLDIPRLYTYISNVAGGVGNTHEPRETQHATQDPHQARDQRRGRPIHWPIRHNMEYTLEASHACHQVSQNPRMCTGSHPVCSLLTLRIRSRGGATIGHPNHIMNRINRPPISSSAAIRTTAWATVSLLLHHLADNDCLEAGSIYEDLPEELADIIFSAITRHQD